MDVQAQTNQSVDRLAVIPPYPPRHVFQQKDAVKVLFFLFCTCNYTSFDHICISSKSAWSWSFWKEKEGVMDLPAHIIPSIVYSCISSLLQVMLEVSKSKRMPPKGCQQSTLCFLPWDHCDFTFIEHMVLLAGKRVCDGCTGPD
jgi:hypothetical protein